MESLLAPLLNEQAAMVAVVGAITGLVLYYLFAYELYRSRLGFLVSAISGALVGLLGNALSLRLGWTFPGWDWPLVAALGAGVAVGELVSRYQDEPARTLRTTPALFYVSLNSAAAVAALMVIQGQALQVQPAISGAAAGSVDTNVHWAQVLTAGLGAMALLRSAVFTVRTADKKDIAVGPSTFLQAIVDATDSALDRLRAQDRARAADRLMKNVIYEKAILELTPLCLRLLQNIPEDRRVALQTRIDSLKDDSTLSEKSKLLALGLYAMTFCGENVVKVAVKTLGAEIALEPTRAETESGREKMKRVMSAVANNTPVIGSAARRTAPQHEPESTVATAPNVMTGPPIVSDTPTVVDAGATVT